MDASGEGPCHTSLTTGLQRDSPGERSFTLTRPSKQVRTSEGSEVPLQGALGLFPQT